mgnify:CR=1 FL=1
MQKNKVYIAKKTLSLLSDNPWDKISFTTVVGSKRVTTIRNKTDLLINLNRYFDYLLNENLVSMEQSSKKDMLFEVFMARLDILNTNRRSIKNLLKFLLSYPNNFIRLLPSFVESMILIATKSNIEVNGIRGVVKVKAIFFLYLLAIYTWNNDESESLEKTMTSLDKYLTNADKIFNLF